MGANGFVGFVPWIIFWVVSSPSTWGYAAGGALIAALILLIPSTERGHVKMLDVVSVLFFGALTVAALFLDRSQLDWLEDYAQAISSGALAIAVLASLAFTPFTEQYAREHAPPEVWATPLFKRINRVLTFAWGLVFAACAVLGVIAQHVHAGTVWLNWIIPIALIIGGLKFTERYPDQARAAAGMPARGASAPSLQHRA
jgi:intracellular septation protein A